MKKLLFLFVFFSATCLYGSLHANAQCSICTKTASQLGEKPAKALNGGIIYLMMAPLSIAAYIGIKWWKREKQLLQQEEK